MAGDGARYVRNDQVVWNTVDGEAVALNPETGVYYGFNTTASVVWQYLASPKTVKEIIDFVASEFSADPTRIHDDVEVLLQDLEQYSLIRIM